MTAPTLTGLDGAAFAENTVNATPQIVDDDVTFTDPDNDYDGGSLTVSGLLAEDRVSIAGDAVVWQSGGGVWYDADGAGGGAAVLIGSATGGAGTTFTVTFDATATAASIEALIEHLAYANVSDTPTATRGLTLNVTDALGNDLDGDPTFAAAVDMQPTGSFPEFSALEPHRSFADVDGDGDLDLVSGDYGGDFTVLRYFENVGSATAPDFVEQYGAENPFVGITDAPRAAFADLDADGDLDLIVTPVEPNMIYYENTGTATAPQYALVTVDSPLEGTRPSVTTGYRGWYPYPAFADLDADGDLDLLLGEEEGFVYYFENVGTATDADFQQLAAIDNPIGSSEDWGSASYPALVDLDLDGDLDAVIKASVSSPFQALENVGGPTTPVFAAFAVNPFAGITPGPQSFADLDGDGDYDLIIGRGTYGHYDFHENITSRIPTIAIGVVAQGEDIVGGNAAETLNGTAEGELILGMGGNDTLNGGGGDDVLEGGAGVDRLDGGTGADDMSGGAGNDTYVVDDLLDTISEAPGAGTDVVEAFVSWTLGDNVERLVLQGAADIDGTGNSAVNQLTGNTGDNVLSGLGGNDILLGGDGADTLVGGQGVDQLTGGAGADIFVFQSTGDGQDRIYDLGFAEGDRIDLSAIDADIGTGGDQAFVFVSRFTGVAGQALLKYDTGNDFTYLRIDVNGDGAHDLQFIISGNHAGSGGNLYTGPGDTDGGWVL